MAPIIQVLSKIWALLMTPNCIFFHYTDYIFSQVTKLLGPIQKVFLYISSLQSPLILYCLLFENKLEYGVGVRFLPCKIRGFKSRRKHGCLSVVCCQVGVYPTNWSLVQRSHIECVVSECDRATTWGGWGVGPLGVVELKKKVKLEPFRV